MKYKFNLKITSFFITISLFYGCSSNRGISDLKSQITCNKTVNIVWDESSNFTKIESIGDFKNDYASFTKGKRLDYKQLFKESIESFNKKYNAKFIFKENLGFPSDSVVQVKVKLDKIVWHKGFSAAIMDCYLEYETSTKEFQITGSSKAQSYAKAGKSILQSLEHSHLQFLLALCNNQNNL